MGNPSPLPSTLQISPGLRFSWVSGNLPRFGGARIQCRSVLGLKCQPMYRNPQCFWIPLVLHHSPITDQWPFLESHLYLKILFLVDSDRMNGDVWDKELPVIPSLFQRQRKRGSWRCQECDVLIGTNLQICIVSHLIISLFCLATLLTCEKSRNLLLAGFLETKRPQRQHPIFLPELS